jgi:hypothetical protein
MKRALLALAALTLASVGLGCAETNTTIKDESDKVQRHLENDPTIKKIHRFGEDDTAPADGGAPAPKAAPSPDGGTPI